MKRRILLDLKIGEEEDRIVVLQGSPLHTLMLVDPSSDEGSKKGESLPVRVERWVKEVFPDAHVADVTRSHRTALLYRYLRRFCSVEYEAVHVHLSREPRQFNRRSQHRVSGAQLLSTGVVTNALTKKALRIFGVLNGKE